MKNKILLLIMAVVLVMPLTTYALKGDLIISCDKTELKKDDVVLCEIKGKSDEEVSAIHGTISVNNKFEIVEITKDSAWEGSSNNTTVDYYTDVNKTKEFKIATVKLKAKAEGEAEISFENVYFVDKGFEKNDVDNATVEISVKTTSSSNNTDETNPDSPLDDGPKTGFILPILMLSVLGVGVASALYISKKKQTIHKI